MYIPLISGLFSHQLKITLENKKWQNSVYFDKMKFFFIPCQQIFITDFYRFYQHWNTIRKDMTNNRCILHYSHSQSFVKMIHKSRITNRCFNPISILLIIYINYTITQKMTKCFLNGLKGRTNDKGNDFLVVLPSHSTWIIWKSPSYLFCGLEKVIIYDRHNWKMEWTNYTCIIFKDERDGWVWDGIGEWGIHLRCGMRGPLQGHFWKVQNPCEHILYII